MITAFDLTVTEDETIRVVYQKPDGYDDVSEIKPVSKKEPVRLGSKIKKYRFIDEERLTDDLSYMPPKKPVVIMIHGFPGGHKGGCNDLYGEMEYRLEGLGYPTIRFDFRGCGESFGKEEDFCIESALADLNAVMQWAQHDAGHRNMILCGESCGATIAVLGYKPDITCGMILLWPALKLMETVFKELFTRESRVESMIKDLPFVTYEGHKIGSHFLNDIYTTDLTSALERINAPTLVQHGTADTEVPFEQIYFARDHVPGVIDMGIFEGGGHGLKNANMRQYMFMNIRHFLERVFKKLDFVPVS